jgi:DNA ligase 1
VADPLQFRYHRGGLHFPALGLWMDPHEPVRDGSLAFVSHAHSDHTGNHSEVVLTEPTRRLMRARVAGRRIEHVLALGETVDSSRLGRREGAFSLRLLPAGHILGSAMALLEAGRRTLLYTGDFKLRRGLSAEPCMPVAADVLVMETTFGRPGYVFPDAAAVVASVIRFCREALDNDEIPLLLGYSLGKSQEILSSLNAAGLPVMLHDSVAKLTRIYTDLGQPFPRWVPWDVKSASGHVLIAPPGGPGGALRRQLPAVRSATLTGWAVDSGCRYRSGTDAAFPLSDHADFPDLVEMVRRVAPSRVFTLHGFAADFAAHLRTLGFDARPLSEEDQLELRLAGNSAVPLPSPPAPAPDPGRFAASAHVPAPEAGSFAQVAGAFEAIRDTASKRAKVELLTGLLRSAEPEDLACLTSWFAGDASPVGSGASRNAGGAVLRDAVRIAAGVTEAEYTAAHLAHNDAGETAAHLLATHGIPGGRRLRIADVRRLVDHLAEMSGAATKVGVLADAFRACTPGEARLLTRILCGNLRIGLREDRVEEAVAEAFAADPGAIRRAHVRLGNLGETAVLARSGRLEDAALSPFRPLKALPATTEVSVADALVQASGWNTGEGAKELWLENAPTGIRVQLHRVGERVALFSQDRREITAAFPELVRTARLLDSDVILDGRIPEGRGKPVEFPGDDLFPSSDPPARFVASDLFWRNGVTLVGLPLRARRRELEGLRLPTGLELSRIRPAVEVSSLEAAVAECRTAGLGGFVLRNPESDRIHGHPGADSIRVTLASPSKPA